MIFFKILFFAKLYLLFVTVEHQLNITKAVDLKPLHKVLFLRAGTNNEIKKNIKQFSGFTYGKDAKEHEKRVAALNKYVYLCTCLFLLS